MRPADEHEPVVIHDKRKVDRGSASAPDTGAEAAPPQPESTPPVDDENARLTPGFMTRGYESLPIFV